MIEKLHAADEEELSITEFKDWFSRLKKYLVDHHAGDDIKSAAFFGILNGIEVKLSHVTK